MSAQEQKLLKLAANAARIDFFHGHPSSIDHPGSDKLYLKQSGIMYTAKEWNPIQSDADAFRLMVALRLSVSYSDQDDGGDFVGVHHNNGYHLARDPGCDQQATRRAIVRAAAAIGEQLEERA